MDKEIALKILRELHDKVLFSERTALETFIPELKESEDEKIRKAILAFVRQSSEVLDKQNQNNMIAWLEKQESVGEIVARCKTSWYNEGKIQGQIEGLTNDEKYQQGWHDAFEKQGEHEYTLKSSNTEDVYKLMEYITKLAKAYELNFPNRSYDIYAFAKDILAWLEKQGDTSEIVNKKKIASDILRGAAINLITWIDYNAAEGNMCLSNMECKDIEDALVSGDWDKIYAYIKKKLEKQQKPMTEEFEHELAEICNQLLSEIDSEWMNNEILDCIGTSVWLNLCDETAKRYKDGLLKLAKQGEQKPAEWGEEDEQMIGRIRGIVEKYAFSQSAVDVNGDLCEKEYIEADTWLKSLKERIK